VSLPGLSIFSLNLRFGLADDGPNRWRHRKAFFPLLLERYPADFYTFQEVNNFQARDLQVMLADYRSIGQRDPAPSYWQNNLIFYHQSWQCTEQHHFYLSKTPDVPSKFNDSKWPRQCTMGVFQQADRRLVCVNTHFDFTKTVQEKSTRLILSRLSELSVAGPTILLGDFNAVPDAGCYQLLTRMPQDAQDTPCPPPRAPVFKNVFRPPFPATHHGFSGKINGDHIDWVLYEGAIEPVEKGVIHDTFNGCYPSDHFPIVVRFKWR